MKIQVKELLQIDILWLLLILNGVSDPLENFRQLSNVS